MGVFPISGTMGVLGATLLVVTMVVVAEAQVVFPSNTPNKYKDCTASNGLTGFCYEFRSYKFKECSFYPSQDTSNPNVARHLTENVCKKTAREIYFCCPSNTSPPKKRPAESPPPSPNCLCTPFYKCYDEETSSNLTGVVNDRGFIPGAELRTCSDPNEICCHNLVKPVKKPPTVSSSKGCRINSQCGRNGRCKSGRCVDPCVSVRCGEGAICQVSQRQGQCVCPAGTEGNPREQCHSATLPGSCATIRCQANAQCVEGSGNKLTKCNCHLGYRSYQNMCIATCKVKDCQSNALCVEGSGAAASVCLCKKGYRSHNGNCLPTCQTTKCPENARCLEGSGSTSTSCKCKNGYKSTRTACIELRPNNTVTQRFNPNKLSTQGFGGFSSLQNQGNSWNQFRNQFPNQFRTPTHNPYQWYNPNRQNAHIK